MKLCSYQTKQILNLSTGRPFEFQVSFKKMRRFRSFLKMTVVPRVSDRTLPLFMRYSTPAIQTKKFEATLFPVYKEFLEVMFRPENPSALLEIALEQLGASEADLQKLMTDDAFKKRAMSLFSGITCDGDRAGNTVIHVYVCAKDALTGTKTATFSDFVDLISKVE